MNAAGRQIRRLVNPIGLGVNFIPCGLVNFNGHLGFPQMNHQPPGFVFSVSSLGKHPPLGQTSRLSHRLTMENVSQPRPQPNRRRQNAERQTSQHLRTIQRPFSQNKNPNRGRHQHQITQIKNPIRRPRGLRRLRNRRRSEGTKNGGAFGIFGFAAAVYQPIHPGRRLNRGIFQRAWRRILRQTIRKIRLHQILQTSSQRLFHKPRVCPQRNSKATTFWAGQISLSALKT